MPKEYKVIEQVSKTELEIEINSQIKEGWEPIGGVAIYKAKLIHENNHFGIPEQYEGTIYVQALTR